MTNWKAQPDYRRHGLQKVPTYRLQKVPTYGLQKAPIIHRLQKVPTYRLHKVHTSRSIEDSVKHNEDIQAILGSNSNPQ